MDSVCWSAFRVFNRVVSRILLLALLVACSPPAQRPTGPARDYEDAKDMFKRGRFDRALDFTEGLASASPPTAFTDRARVLRIIVFSGRIKAYKELADAYGKGVDNTKNPHFKGVFGQQRHDSLQYGASSALGLAETAHQFTQGGTFPREVTVEAPYPIVEGPVEVRELVRVSDGGWIEPEQQDAAALDSVRKGIDDALAEALKGDRSKARAELGAGPVKIDGVDFALHLGKELLGGARFFDRKHIHDIQRFKIVANEAGEVAKAALALLKENPDKQKESEIKRLQSDVKTAVKRGEV